jgi:hypothetical protein
MEHIYIYITRRNSPSAQGVPTAEKRYTSLQKNPSKQQQKYILVNA